MERTMTKIENQTQYKWVESRIEELLTKVDNNTPETDPTYIELVLWSNLMADYSDEHYAVGKPTLVDVIKLRMYERGLTQATLAKLLGVSASRICDYLSGKSEPTMKVARKISTTLDIDPAIVLGV